MSQLQRTIDLDRWGAARSWRDNFKAVSWPRAGAILGGLLVAFAVTTLILTPKGIRGYPPPLPSQETLNLREQGLKGFTSTPPGSLAEAHRSVGAGGGS